MMARELRVCLLFFHILFNIDANSGFLDFDELNSVSYGIDIINKPIPMGQELPDGAIQLMSKYGQQYQCTYPNRVVEDQRERQEEQAAIKTGIPDLLRPMADGPCLQRPKDWWTYEFCYGKYIKQYHVEDNKIVGDILYLGYYESDFDWNNVTEKDKKRRYHSQYFVNGSTCDLTNKARRAEVQFRCEEGQGDYIFEMGEAETCVYTFVVHTPRLCRHPYLKKPTPAKPVPIICKPVITPEQYEEYLENLQDVVDEDMKPPDSEPSLSPTALEEPVLPQTSEAEKSSASHDAPSTGDFQAPGSGKVTVSHDSVAMVSDEREDVIVESEEEDSPKNKKEDGNPVEDTLEGKEGRKEIETGRLEKLFMDSLSQGMKDVIKKDSNDQKGMEVQGVKVKVMKNVAEFERYMDDLMKDEQQTGTPEGVEQAGDTASQGSLVQHDEVTESEDEDNDIVEEFDKELNVIAPTPEEKERLAEYRDNVESAMQAKFSDIVDEAEGDLKREGFEDPVDRKQAFGKLAKTLSQLLKKLQKAEKEIKKVDSHLKETQETNTLEGSDSKQIPQEPTEESSQSMDGSEELGHGAGDEVSTTPEAISKQETEQPSRSEPKVIGNRVQVRVTRIKHGNSDDSAKEGSHPQSSSGQKSLQIPEEQRKQLETSVKNELQKAGIENTGQEIQVKIITAGYFDSNSDTVHVLSEEESSAFNNMIVTILGGNNQASKELARQQQMEETYNNVWGKPNQRSRRDHTAPAPPS